MMNSIIEYTDEMVKRAFPKRPADCNKGDFGYIALIGGSLMYSGAIRLAALANSAVRSGAGVVSVAAPDSICPLIAPQIMEATLFPMPERDGMLVFDEDRLTRLAKRYDTIAFGMGAGLNDETVKIARFLLSEFGGTLIADADGINALAKLGKAEISSHKGNLVITPHLKEFSRISGQSIETVLSDRTGEAERLAAELDAVVLLKGHETVVTDGLQTFSVKCGCPGMATAGSGDVLSGIAAAVLSDRFAKDVSLCERTAAAAMINGRAGELAERKLGEVSMAASDTAACIAEYIGKILS